MSFCFKPLGRPKSIDKTDWKNWKWQLKQLKNSFQEEKKTLFLAGTTPYYLRLIHRFKESNLHQIVKPTKYENLPGLQSFKDPLGEEKYSSTPNLIHRYPDRVLFLITDTCGVYCRFCTRKRYTGKQKAFVSKINYKMSLDYIKKNEGIREVILSGGDPLTLSNSLLEKILKDLRVIRHVEIIRIASRMPVVCPMRFTPQLIKILQKYNPVFLMLHFNHPDEITKEVADTLKFIADSGILMFNQTVILNGINNHPAILQALLRRLLYLRVKPYYLFQCDPSEGSDHFRTSIKDSIEIQKELWGRLSGLSLPNLSLDIPEGGGKAVVVPNYLEKIEGNNWTYKGWDGVVNTYKNPRNQSIKKPKNKSFYKKEWFKIKKQKYGRSRNLDSI
ncbi:MAG: KamA family radical SAM protein [Bdellovibrionales bacterium]|nr:KamA family radical SAM protein [Bdellovibrionales bacterium]